MSTAPVDPAHTVVVHKSREGVFFAASILPISDGLEVTEPDIPRLNYPTPASTYGVPTENSRVNGSVAKERLRRSDVQRQEITMCKIAQKARP